ncbi:MAG: hypothetical protein LBU40_03065 [Methanobrevibacter sp.]|jgi:hypothetical protein|nr:hypothetical protein [Methanobrevibacter sp.]
MVDDGESTNSNFSKFLKKNSENSKDLDLNNIPLEEDDLDDNLDNKLDNKSDNKLDSKSNNKLDDDFVNDFNEELSNGFDEEFLNKFDNELNNKSEDITEDSNEPDENKDLRDKLDFFKSSDNDLISKFKTLQSENLSILPILGIIVSVFLFLWGGSTILSSSQRVIDSVTSGETTSQGIFIIIIGIFILLVSILSLISKKSTFSDTFELIKDFEDDDSKHHLENQEFSVEIKEEHLNFIKTAGLDDEDVDLENIDLEDIDLDIKKDTDENIKQDIEDIDEEKINKKENSDKHEKYAVNNNENLVSENSNSKKLDSKTNDIESKIANSEENLDKYLFNNENNDAVKND